MISAVIFILSLVAMLLGAEMLVMGASRLAAILGISHLVIGLTIVSFGTSAPELVVSIKGVLTNHSDLVVGNCIGSNIFNIFFIIGACAAIAPLVVTKQLVRIDVPLLIAGHLFFLLLCLDGKISSYDGLWLLATFALYYSFVVYKSQQEDAADSNRNEVSNARSSLLLAIIKQVGFIGIGLLLCIIGADSVVDNAVILARFLGLSELVIGLTIVSIGTSLPEVATSIVATIRGQRDIAIGNAIGSCIFNVLGIIGIASVISPEGITIAPSILSFDLPVAIVASIACLPIFFSGYMISRWEGFLFLFYYAAYLSYLILKAHQHDILPMISAVMLWFVIPLSALTLMVIGYRAIRSN